jgi:hypothetical protein
MAKCTDPRFEKSRFQGAPGPRKYPAARGGASASAKAFKESERRMQSRPVVVSRDPRARTS